MFPRLIKDNYLLVILGPTAGGKTAVAANIAHVIKGEVISADSRQVYKDMNLGTGKDYDDYIVNGKSIPYHLIDIVDAGRKYNLFEYQKDFIAAYTKIVSQEKFPVLCGGTGLYIEAVTQKYKMQEVPPDFELRQELEQKSLDELTQILASYKKLHNSTDIDTKKRAIRAIEIEKFQYEKKEPLQFPDIKPIYFGVKNSREVRRERITKRLHQRLEEGMVDEVQKLLDRGIPAIDLIYYGLEYKFLTLYLTHQLSFSEMIEKLNIAIHQFAKRQMTWFRKMERQGIPITWLESSMPMEQKQEIILSHLKQVEEKCQRQ